MSLTKACFKLMAGEPIFWEWLEAYNQGDASKMADLESIQAERYPDLPSLRVLFEDYWPIYCSSHYAPVAERLIDRLGLQDSQVVPPDLRP